MAASSQSHHFHESERPRRTCERQVGRVPSGVHGRHCHRGVQPRGGRQPAVLRRGRAVLVCGLWRHVLECERPRGRVDALAREPFVQGLLNCERHADRYKDPATYRNVLPQPFSGAVAVFRPAHGITLDTVVVACQLRGSWRKGFHRLTPHRGA